MSTTQHPALFISRLPAHQEENISAELTSQGIALTSVDTTNLDEWLEDNMPRALLVGPDEQTLQQAADLLRAKPRYSMVPIIWVADEVSGITFEKAYARGADDVADANKTDGIVRRILSTPEKPLVVDSTERGTVLVADPDERRNALLGRVLYNAAFDVKFAQTLEDVLRNLNDEIVAVLASADFGIDSITTSIELAHNKGSLAPWVIATPPKLMQSMSKAVEELQPAVVYDGFAPVENGLFILNDTLSGFVAENRASPRLLYGAPVSFRVAGLERDEMGYVYNISDGGVYIRTLAPLNRGDDAWIELQPPRSPRRVRLDAKVVWTRKHGGAKVASIPPGFGVSITDASKVDRTMYSEGYESLARYLSGVRSSIRPDSVKDPSILPLR